MTSMNQHLQTAQPDLIPHAEARARWFDFSAGVVATERPYLTRSNKKTDKNAIPTISFTGSPARTTTLNCCTHSTTGCRHVCIRYTGRLEIPQAQQVGIDRTEFLRVDPDAAVSLIHWETVLASKRHPRVGRRLNIVTDLNWDAFAGWLFTEAPENVVTYDYTKDWSRDEWPAPRYRVCFSATEHHSVDAIRAKTETGACVAVVFGPEFETATYAGEWHGIPVIDGDLSDFRYYDAPGHVVALYAKGRARKIEPGPASFVKVGIRT
jgi:hypothetical protein